VLDAAIALIAGRQFGYITRVQLLDLGLDGNAIDYRLRTGRLIRVYAGVYAVGHVPATPVARAFAAVLACGDGAVLSHSTALCVWGIHKRWLEPFEVTARSSHRHSGIRVHRSSALTTNDITKQLDLPVTSPAKMLLDTAPDLAGRRLTRAVNDLRHARYLHLSELHDVIERFPRAPGAKLLVPFVLDPTNPTRSTFEDLFPPFCVRHGFPTPVMNEIVAGHEVDALFPEQRVVVELDSWEYHNDRHSFEHDRSKDADLIAAGHLPIRITWQRFIREGDREAVRLQSIIDSR
jgi:hypothetical protein